ncbi:MAG: hypothetical protein AABX35_00430 [Nanoarchaeota archaeon]
MEDDIKKRLIPLDKSWVIRMGVLDLVNGNDETEKFLNKHKEELSDDLIALLRAMKQWKSEEKIEVGESGTLYRFLKFASWKLNKNKEFILSGTLKDRKICDNSEIINWTLDKLLTLDNGTSQWASAALLLGNKDELDDAPYKLIITLEAIDDWNYRRKNKIELEYRYDETIYQQAISYVNWLKTGEMNFKSEQAEDYCFARAFGVMSKEEGEKKWPSLRGHESDRIEEMEKALLQEEVDSRDHRVVQAIAMLKKGKVKFKHPEAVKKSWPEFWKFLEYANQKTNSFLDAQDSLES